jgi:hypothetical protein
MLAHILAIAVGFGSFILYMAAFFFPEVHRKYDFVWSGVGFFYALVLWVCAGRITGGVLLGQTASVVLLGWLGWQALAMRRELTPTEQKTQLPGSAKSFGEVIHSKVTQLQASLPRGVRVAPLPENLKFLRPLVQAVTSARDWVQGIFSSTFKPKQRPPSAINSVAPRAEVSEMDITIPPEASQTLSKFDSEIASPDELESPDSWEMSQALFPPTPLKPSQPASSKQVSERVNLFTMMLDQVKEALPGGRGRRKADRVTPPVPVAPFQDTEDEIFDADVVEEGWKFQQDDTAIAPERDMTVTGTQAEILSAASETEVAEEVEVNLKEAVEPTHAPDPSIVDGEVSPEEPKL